MNSYPKQMITMLLANANQNQIKRRTQKKGILSRLPKSPSSPRTPIQIGERRLTPTIAWWKSHGYIYKKEGRGRRRTMKKNK